MQPDDPNIVVPAFDPDTQYLDGQVRAIYRGRVPSQTLYHHLQIKRIFSAGRYDVFEVLGYGFPPN
jgi:hypothetical protein